VNPTWSVTGFASVGLEQQHLAIQISQLALDFERRYPERAQALVARHRPRVTRDDLRVAGFVIRLGKRARR